MLMLTPKLCCYNVLSVALHEERGVDPVKIVEVPRPRDLQGDKTVFCSYVRCCCSAARGEGGVFCFGVCQLPAIWIPFFPVRSSPGGFDRGVFSLDWLLTVSFQQ